MNLVTILVFIVVVCGLAIYWKKLPRKRDRAIWAGIVLLFLAMILIDLFYPRISTNLYGRETVTTVSANQIWLGIIILVSIISLVISGYLSIKKPNITNRKLFLISIIPPIIALILFISDLFY